MRKKKESRKGRKNGKIVEENEEGEGKDEKSVSNGGEHQKGKHCNQAFLTSIDFASMFQE